MVTGSTGTVVLMYHSLLAGPEEAEGVERGESIYMTGAERFDEHLATLESMGIPVTVHSDPPAGGMSVMLTFDDGNASDRSIALPLLEKRGMKAAFFITTGAIGSDGRSAREDIEVLHRSGMIIGSHGVTHRFLTDLGPAELEEELRRSREDLEEITGSPVDSISAPGGRIDRGVLRAAVEAGYRFIYSSKPRVNERIEERVPAGRFAVTDRWDAGTLRRVASGNPPPSIALRHAALSGARLALGNRLYARLRGRLLGD